MRKNFPFSLGFKFSAIVLVMGLLIGALVVFIGSQIYGQGIINHYTRASIPLAETVIDVVRPDKIDDYYASGKQDAAYKQALEDLRLCAIAGDTRYIYIFKPTEEGCSFIFDTDEDESTAFKLGSVRPWEEGLADEKEKVLAGRPLEVEIADEAADGWLLTVYVPLTDNSGKFVGYLGVDYDAAEYVEDQMNFVLRLTVATLFLSALMTAAFLPFLRRLAVRPINQIAGAANTYLESTDELMSESNSITELNIQTPGEIQDLSLSLKQMEAEIKDHVKNLEETTLRAETDSMTGLLNREAFERRVTAVLEGVGSDASLGTISNANANASADLRVSAKDEPESSENKAGRRVDVVGAGRRAVDGVGGASPGRRASDLVGLDSAGIGRRAEESNAKGSDEVGAEEITYHIFIMVDLDKFKQINDSCGHLAGDRILTSCARVMKSCFRPTDFVARMGGDEFAAFFVSTSYEEAEKRAKEIGSKLRNIQIREGLTASASIGVAVLPSEKGQTYQMFYIMADDLLYEAKARGRDRYSITKER